MRAREFITEQRELPPEQAEPMRYTYVIPGLSASDPYNNYRFGVAMARARSDAGADEHSIDPFKPEWTPETAFGEHGVVVGMNSNIEQVIDQALKMTNTPGGKELVSTANSIEPTFVDTTSPIKAFKGYPR
jgi:hypothetical protein